MTASAPRRLLLISNTVLHYRVSVYNFLSQSFAQNGWSMSVLTNQLKPGNRHPVEFPLTEEPFNFKRYRQRILAEKPDAVILFLHLKDRILWPLIHWLKWRGIPVIFWTKGANLDRPDSKLRYHLFNYVHSLSNALILYSENQIHHLKPSNRPKAVAANNTLNFHDFPEITQSRDEIRRELDIPFEKVVLFVGTMGIDGERKKVEHLIAIFRSLQRDDIGLIIVGSGMPEQSKAQIDPRNTRYLGEVHDPTHTTISKLFKTADLFVVPGHIGLGLNQAFYWGLPVVTEAGKQPPEIHILKSGRNGFIVPEDDIEAVREKMLLLLDNDGMRKEFSENARADVLRDASVENMFRAFHQAVNIACSKSSQSGQSAYAGSELESSTP